MLNSPRTKLANYTQHTYYTGTMSFLYGKILAQNPEPPWLQCELQAFNGVPCLDKLLDASLRSANFIQGKLLDLLLFFSISFELSAVWLPRK